MKNVLKNKRILLGITGGISAYKSAALASLLTKQESVVDVVMTESGRQFVTPVTFEALTHRSVYSSMFGTSTEKFIPHIELAEQSDLMIVAPATANSIAKLTHGIADNLLTAVLLAARSAVILAPAMETKMWENPATRENIRKLKERGIFVAEPQSGRLASGTSGAGRMAEPEYLLECIKGVLGKDGDYSGRRVTVTAGATREPIDPVRFISNPSSGKMGYALSLAARDRGAAVTLISGNRAHRSSFGIDVVPAETVTDMKKSVMHSIVKADVLIMAAAVSDFRIKKINTQKIKKESGTLTLELVRTEDILEEVTGYRDSTKNQLTVIGFAAETENMIANAREKLKKKKLDGIAANLVTEKDSGFAGDTIRISMLFPDGPVVPFPLTGKAEAAHLVLDQVIRLWKTEK